MIPTLFQFVCYARIEKYLGKETTKNLCYKMFNKRFGVIGEDNAEQFIKKMSLKYGVEFNQPICTTIIL